MTANYPPPPPPPADDYLLPPAASTTAPLPATSPPPSADEPGTAEVAKEQTANVAQGAAQAGQHVAVVAKDQAGEVSAEAGRQLKDLLAQAQGQLSEQAGVQQQKLVGGLRSLGDELTSMTQNVHQPGIASDLARQAAARTASIAGWLDGREPAALLDDITAFARRRPGAFLAVAGGIGFVAGRLTRGLTAQSAGPDTATTTPPPPPVTPPVPYPGPDATTVVPPAPAVGLSEPLAPPIVPASPTPGHLGEAQ